MFVKDVMNIEPYLLHEEETILSASKFMREEKIRNLPVVDNDKKLVGLITLREIINMLLGNPDKILIRDAMIKLVISVSPDTLLKEAVEIMLINKYGCLPVIDSKKKLIGMLTESDLLRVIHKYATLPV